MEAFGTRLDGVKTQKTIIVGVITVVSCVFTLALKEESRLRVQNADKDIVALYTQHVTILVSEVLYKLVHALI
jgi:hypothetical protein